METLGRKDFWRNSKGAVAATYALALPMLVAVAGVGFDYARLAGMDSELQNAADQAALAGVTQLDGKPGACNRAVIAAQGGLVANSTWLASDSGTGGTTSTVAVPTVVFYATVDDAEEGTNAFDATDDECDAAAKFVGVEVEQRTAEFAFTPIVSAFAGDIVAGGVAGINSAICKAAVLFMCNMDDGDPNFTLANYIGRGVNVTKEGSKGNWGFVGPGNDNPTLRQTLGLDAAPYACVSVDGAVDVAPGNDANKHVVDAFNTRFDLGNGCPVAGGCSASANSTKDLVANQGSPACTSWAEAANPYAPTGNDTYANLGQALPEAMGYPRDICHASGATCASGDPDIVGDAKWDVDAYFRVNYGVSNWDTNSNLLDLGRNGQGGRPLRYDVYKWELEHSGEDVFGNGRRILVDARQYASKEARGAPQCLSGIVPSPSNIDRRLISLAVISKAECAKIKGNSYNPVVDKWVDAFLIEPMADRSKTYRNGGGTSSKEIYVEIVRETPAGGQAENPVRRDVPYLVR